ncbi:MAG: GNAT family N-acetyltransferase [Candidatus Nealsonbacteria bacterium]|nr:GNAT family N-acetyltransferase [Candidatus Nealsonbacteria bacterium]
MEKAWLPEIISNENINLRPISWKSIAQDAENVVKWAGDSDVRDALRYFSFFHNGATLDRQLEYFCKIIESRNDHIFVIGFKSGEFLGTCGLHDIDWVNNNLRIGIIIFNKNYWRQGYGTSSLNLLLGFAFGKLGMNKVYLTARADNDLAIHIYEKFGFKREGVMRDEYRVEGGRYIDLLRMSILKSEWK